MEWNKLLCAKRQRNYHAPANQYDRRSEFQKDYHRIIGSASFRRLQDKTQVFPLDKSDFVRTRLTHSLEVSSFAKSLGQTIFRAVIDSGQETALNEQMKEDICSVLECAGLIHDIGNPPFGHFGEDYIRSFFKKALPEFTFRGKKVTELLNEQMISDLYHFEGNAQALRLVTKLHFLVDENGMNLTYALLNTIIKYPVSSLETDKNSGDIRTKKIGYYYSERDIFRDINENTGALGRRYPLVYILEAADDIAYKTADIEDAVKKGFITLPQIAYELKHTYRELCESEDEVKEFDSAAEKLDYYYEKALSRGISSPEQNAVQRWVINTQTALLRCASYGFMNNYGDIMDGSFKTEILSASGGKTLAYALSDLAYRYVFTSKPIYKLEIAASAIFDHLLSKFVGAAIRFDSDEQKDELDEKLIALISENYIKAYRHFSDGKDENEKLYLRIMLAADYICGMTDSYAKRLYQELSGID